MTPKPVIKYPSGMPKLKTAARGYGGDHQKKKRGWARVVDAGNAICVRCGRPILPGQAWDLGHVDGDKSSYSGPEHRYAKDCPAGGNRATNRKGRKTAKKRLRRRRSW